MAVEVMAVESDGLVKGAAEGVMVRTVGTAMDTTMTGLLALLREDAGLAVADGWSLHDWDEVVRVADAHGVAPLLCYRLQSAGAQAHVPADAWRRLQGTYMACAAVNVRRFDELAGVLKTCQRDQLPVIVLKGGHLATIVYDNFALRPMGDVDLLVRAADVSRMETRLAEMGYRPSEDNAWMAREHYHVTYRLPDKQIKVEIHWHIELPTSAFQIPIDELWEEAQPAAINGVPALVLAPTALLLHLAIHTSTHHIFGGFGIRPLCDIAEVMRHYRNELDWAALAARARRWGVSRPLYLTLRLTRELLGVEAPETMLAAIAPTTFDDRFLDFARARLLAEGADETGGLSNNLRGIWAAPRLSAKLGHLAAAFFPSREVMARLCGLPSSGQVRLYHYPRRWLDLLWRRTAGAWRLLRRDPELLVAWADREAGRTALMAWLAQPERRR